MTALQAVVCVKLQFCGAERMIFSLGDLRGNLGSLKGENCFLERFLCLKMLTISLYLHISDHRQIN